MPHSRPAKRHVLGIALAASLLATPVLAQTDSAAPATACGNFHGFANADWLAANTAATAPVTRMSQLQAQASTQQRQLLDAAMQTPQGALQTWLGDFWASGLDEAAIERAGATPLAPLLAIIDDVDRQRDIAPAIAALHKTGITPLFGFAADADLRDRNASIGYFTQGGLGLPDPAYYTRDDARTAALLMQYRDYVRKVLALSGVPEKQLDAQTKAVLAIETRIAQASKPLSLLRSDESRYAPVAVAGLDAQYPQLELDEFLKTQGVEAATVSLANPQLFAALDAMVKTIDPDTWRAYLRFHVGDALAPYLSKPWRDAHFALHGALLHGQVAPEPHTQQVLETINLVAGPMLGQAYAARYLSAASDARAEEIAAQVRDALRGALQDNTWMSPQAKSRATTRLDALTLAIGAPPRQVADDALPKLDRASFAGNVLAVAALRHRLQMQRIGGTATQPWSIPPQQPGLHYDLADNRLVATAALLQPPVLDMTQPAATQYGAFGALVGHELSHGFNAGGVADDPSGGMWTVADRTAWGDRMTGLTAQYVGYPIPVPPGRTFDANAFIAESSADLAGVELAHRAFIAANPAPDQSAQQAFYRAWAQLWAQQLSPAQVEARVAIGNHAPGYWRSNGPLLNQTAFAKAFSCKADDPMTVTEEDRVSIWD